MSPGESCKRCKPGPLESWRFGRPLRPPPPRTSEPSPSFSLPLSPLATRAQKSSSVCTCAVRFSASRVLARRSQLCRSSPVSSLLSFFLSFFLLSLPRALARPLHTSTRARATARFGTLGSDCVGFRDLSCGSTTFSVRARATSRPLKSGLLFHPFPAASPRLPITEFVENPVVPT